MFIFVLAAALLVSPAVFAKKKMKKVLSKNLTVTSASFSKNAVIPVKYAFTEVVSGGENISPQLSWKTKRKDIKSFAVFMYDKHPVAQNYVHWCVVNIPPTVKSLAEGASGNNMPAGSVEIVNPYGGRYEGPYPPPGDSPHEYEFRVVGLNVPTLDLMNCTLYSFQAAVKGKTLAKGKYLGRFQR